MSVSVLRPQQPVMAPTSTSGTRVLGSLVFNMEVDGNAEARMPVQSVAAAMANIHAVVERLSIYTRPMPGFPSKLLREVKRLKTQLLQEEEQVDAVVLAARLQERGYSVLVRCALGGAANAGAPGSCFRNLRHEFVSDGDEHSERQPLSICSRSDSVHSSCHLSDATNHCDYRHSQSTMQVFVRCESGEYEGVELLVDPNFRDQFAVPQPTPFYAQLLANVPEVFVGTSVRLHPVVELICNEMAQSFKERGLTIPPWRAPSAMMSKWLPAKVKDISVDSPSAEGGSPREVSPRPTGVTADTSSLFPPKPNAAAILRVGGVFNMITQREMSPEQRLREAAQQLEALELHSQQHASPKQSPTGMDAMHSTLIAPPPALHRPTPSAAPTPQPQQQAPQQVLVPTVTLGPIALQARQTQVLPPVHEQQHTGNANVSMLQRHSDIFPPPDASRTHLGALTPSLAMLYDLTGDNTSQDQANALKPNLFSRISEPLSVLQSRASRAMPVSLLSVQLATGRTASTATTPTHAAAAAARPSLMSSMSIGRLTTSPQQNSNVHFPSDMPTSTTHLRRSPSSTVTARHPTRTVSFPAQTPSPPAGPTTTEHQPNQPLRAHRPSPQQAQQQVGTLPEVLTTLKSTQWIGPVIHTVKLAYPPDTRGIAKAGQPSSPAVTASP